MSKKELRKFFLSQLKKLPQNRKKEARKQLNLKLLLLSNKYTLIASFAPFSYEIDLWDFNNEMMKQKKLALPRVSGKDLIFYPVSSMNDLEKSNWGIFEPKTDEAPLKIEDISLFIVPALAFDINNHRLGKGKGFYDTFISKNGVTNTLGIGYKEQFSKKPFPIELHDKALNEILLF